MRGARSLRRQHRAAHVLTPGGHRIPGAPWRRYRLGVTQRFSGILSPENFQGGGGPSKVCEFQGRLPHGVPRADFFWRGQTFDYFLEIKDFKRRPRSPSGSSASLFNGLRPASALHQQHCRVGEANIFPTRPRLPGGASQSSAGSYGRPRGRRTRFSAKFRKLFLPPRSRKKRREIQGGGVGRTAPR